jgi:uncharacterized membrane protein YgaE (UPF0421/DUF939 family)
VNDSRGKSKPTLDSLLKDQQVVTGKDLIRRHNEQERQKALLQEAIEFEQRNRSVKTINLDNNNGTN